MTAPRVRAPASAGGRRRAMAGGLTLRTPVGEEAKPKQIPIETG